MVGGGRSAGEARDEKFMKFIGNLNTSSLYIQKKDSSDTDI